LLLHKEQRLRNGILLVCLLLVDVLVVNHYVGMQNLIDSEARQITGQAPGSVFQAALWQRESVYRIGGGRQRGDCGVAHALVRRFQSTDSGECGDLCGVLCHCRDWQ
jgi:hypothetical protein